MAQTIDDLWRAVLREVGSSMQRDSATMPAFFCAQIMRFYKIHRLMKKGPNKGKWCRRRCRRNTKRCGTAAKDKMLRFMEREQMRKEDILSGPL